MTDIDRDEAALMLFRYLDSYLEGGRALDHLSDSSGAPPRTFDEARESLKRIDAQNQARLFANGAYNFAEGFSFALRLHLHPNCCVGVYCLSAGLQHAVKSYNFEQYLQLHRDRCHFGGHLVRQ